MMKAIQTGIAISLLMVPLTGCLHQSPRLGRDATVSTAGYEPPTPGVTEVIQKGHNVPQLLATAKTLIAQRRFDDSKEVLSQMDDTTLSNPVQVQKTLLDAEIAIKDNQPGHAVFLLKKMSTPSKWPLERQVHYHQLLASAFAMQGEYMASLREKIYLNDLFREPTQQAENERDIWEMLQEMEVSTLEREANFNQNDSVLVGWLRLAIISLTRQEQPDALANGLAAWRHEYPDHPGNHVLPKRILTKAAPAAHHVALLLPTTGELGKLSQAVRDGFMTAYQFDKQNNKPEVRVYDTHDDREVATAYQKATKEGADFVIGPLTKQGVKALMQVQENHVPILSLNQVPLSSDDHPFYQFGLSPEDEARASAELAWSRGATHALVIAMKNDWGSRVADAFQSEWQQLGGETIDTVYFTSKKDLAGPIRRILQIDASQSRASKLKSVLNESIHFEPRRRQDIDVIFLAAFAGEARQIRPLLSFYYANNVPVYATASIYGGTPSPSHDKDLNGITFCDMPWILTPKKTAPELHAMIAEVWPKSLNDYPRLYALGIDAYRLIPQLDQLSQVPNIQFNGATGALSLSSQKTLVRRLTCAQFSKGQPVIVKHNSHA